MNLTNIVPVAVAVTVGIGSSSNGCKRYKSTIIGINDMRKPVVLVVGFKLATLLVPYVPGLY
jgi:hypothetical protein